MINYARTFYMDSTTEYPAGQVFDRMVILEDSIFDEFSASWKVGNTSAIVTATQIASALSGQVLPGVITNVSLTSGKVLLSRD